MARKSRRKGLGYDKSWEEDAKYKLCLSAPTPDDPNDIGPDVRVRQRGRERGDHCGPTYSFECPGGEDRIRSHIQRVILDGQDRIIPADVYRWVLAWRYAGRSAVFNPEYRIVSLSGSRSVSYGTAVRRIKAYLGDEALSELAI
jgi:hypothetical protein